jgi:tetratricopeptide (TPR) repeat protein
MMARQKQGKPAALVMLPAAILIMSFTAAALRAQTNDSVELMKEKVADLIKYGRLTETVPLLEKLVVAEPKEPKHQVSLGFGLLAQAASTQDATEAKQLRVRARNAFIKAKELGTDEPRIDGLIEGIPESGSVEGGRFSPNVTADTLMTAAEADFSQGKMDEALANYQKALDIDPHLYEAALFCGDVYLQKGDYTQAEAWYQKAIAIDPNREIAYRYSATPLEKQGKTLEARDRYIEAYITEPYNKLAQAGLVGWGQATKTALAHPRIDIPVKVTYDAGGKININMDASVMLSKAQDGSSAWIVYGGTRKLWKDEKFAKTYPNETTYRHSLAEEVDAIRTVLSLAAEDKNIKTLSPALAKLKKLNDEGLLEAYILIAKPDAGIAKDYRDYLQQHRDKLRQYAVEYVLTGGGK